MPANTQNQTIAQPLNNYDRKNAYQHFMNDFNKECSIISYLFFGITETTNICLFCKDFYCRKEMNYPIFYNYEIFNLLIFPLEEVKNFRNNNCANFNAQSNVNNIVTLYDCFFYNQATRMFTGDNKNYCSICKKKSDSKFKNRICKSPKIFILILDRGKDNKYDIKLDFTEVLNLTQFILIQDLPKMIYILKGVIAYYGQSGTNAHFIAFCKSPINNKWYKYNDAFVIPVTDIKMEFINVGTPYILFYEKSNYV